MADEKPYIEPDLLSWTIKQIDQFLASHPEITPARLGHLVMNDTALVKRLKSGGDITTRKFCRLHRFFLNPDFQKEIMNVQAIKQQ